MATRFAFVDDSGETRLAGFLVPEPGGSSAYGTSYLGSFGASSLTLTNDPQVATFDVPADLKHGTDIALNVDGQTFEINTDGWYSVYVDMAGSGSADSDAEAALSLDVTSLDASDILKAMNGMFQINFPIAGSRTPEGALSLPPFNFKAGDSFQVVVTGSLLAGTAPTVGTNIMIVRAA